MSHVFHTLSPVYDAQSRVLILGTMPSPKSRQAGFYYSHPQNRFWRILAAVFEEPVPQNNAQREALVRAHHIALWDVLAACDIEGAGDASIRNPKANDLRPIFEAAPIRAVFTTGQKATQLYRRLCLSQTGLECIRLPSPSAANCRGCTLESLIPNYLMIKHYVDDSGADCMIKIRDMTAADLEPLAGLYREFWDEASDLAAMRRQFLRLAETNTHILLCAEQGGALAGSVMGVVCEELYGDCRPFLVVENMIVRRAFRRQGVGHALLAELESRARARGCTQMLLVTERTRPDACAFYEAEGFSAGAHMGYKKKINL